MPGLQSVGGLVSGIDTNTILDQLRELAETPIRRLEERKARLSDQSVAWSQFEVKLIAFQALAVQLAQPVTFRTYTAATSHSQLVTASASASATAGSYSFTIQQLAQTHQKISGGYADISQTEFGVGTLSIQVGDDDPTVVQTEGLTLAELRDAINLANAGVTAAIINDGSQSSPYRLIITSNASGLVGQMIVSSSGAAPILTDLQVAQDAQITLGSGSVTITSNSNTIADAIPGVTLNLLAAAPSTSVTLTISRDLAYLQGLISDLIDNYNELANFFNQQFYYDPDINQSGTLFSDYRLQSLQQDLAAALSNPIVGLVGNFKSLSQLGIRVDSTGKLTQDSTALSAALSTDADAVTAVFAAIGKTTHNSVTYLTSTSETLPSGGSGWAVEVTQAATRSYVTAGVAQADTLLTDETLTIQGVQIELTAGMTPEEVVTAINEQQTQTGVTASRAGGKLTLTRIAYGTTFHVEAVSNLSNQGGGGSRTSGIGNVTVSDESPAGESGGGIGQTGKDVQGTIGGKAATGSGQTLTGSEGGPKGLALLITAGAPGSYGAVTFTMGAAEAASRIALSASNISIGTIATAQSQLGDLITDIDAEIARLQDRIDQEQERLRESFTRMEIALGQFQAQSQYLASQFAQMQRNAASTNG